MRLLGVQISGIGGLSDGTAAFSDHHLVAIAGSNGTGKSKLLACVLAPWSGYLPAPSDPESGSEVRVRCRLEDNERALLDELSQRSGWNGPPAPAEVELVVRQQPMVGIQRTSDPVLTVLSNFTQNAEFLQRAPSLNVVYLPAERRLLPASQSGIDLSQLSEALALQKTSEARNSIQNYGRLDDQEFEQYAKALCVAASLPSEPDHDTPSARIEWPEFKGLVDSLLEPKRLLDLTRQHPDNLRVRTPECADHPVPELSSGERQALIIVSRVARARTDGALVLIDEPDAYLHPTLSRRLIDVLQRSLGTAGQLVVATHSPGILDGLPPSAILRLQHSAPPRIVESEDERIELYREAGFRASTLTQSDALVITEGETDVELLALLLPEMARAGVRSAGGRARVIREVEQLMPYSLPVFGAVDRDVLAPPVASELEDCVFVWPAADFEGVLLSDAPTLAAIVETGLVKPAYAHEGALSTLINELAHGFEGNVVAELAQRRLRATLEVTWPSPRGEGAVDRLRVAARALTTPSSEEIDEAIEWAQSEWTKKASDPLKLVRGKYLSNHLASKATHVSSGRALLEIAAKRQPEVAALAPLRDALRAALA